MKNVYKIVILVLVGFLITQLFAILGMFILLHDDDAAEYYLAAGWNCDDETFTTEYYDVCYKKLLHLKDYYGLSFKELIEFKVNDSAENNKIILYFYTDEYTIRFSLINDGAIGYYHAYLYYYGDGMGFGEYDAFSPLVEFINSFTNYVAYDTKSEENRFQQLYNEAANNENLFARDEYHHDDIIGSVFYRVNLDYEAGYYYKAEKNKEIEKKCYLFEFKGLLNHLQTSNQ